MKKFVVRSLLILAVLIVLAVLGTYFFLGTVIKKGVETVGPKITKTDVKLNSASLSILSGSGKINGFVLGNPQGFKTPAAISVGTVNLAIEPRSLFDNKVIIRDITVDGPEITFETDLTVVNLKKLEVDNFLIKNAKVHVSVNAPLVGQQTANVTIPEIHLTNMGTNADGITAAELSRQVLAAIVEKSA